MYYARWGLAGMLLAYLSFMVWYFENNKIIKPPVILPHEFVSDFNPDWNDLYKKTKSFNSVNVKITVDFLEECYCRGGFDIFLVDGDNKVIVGSCFALFWPEAVEQVFVKNLSAGLINFDKPPSPDTKLIISPFSIEGQEPFIPRVVVKSIELCK
jgi:hypothetical protein